MIRFKKILAINIFINLFICIPVAQAAIITFNELAHGTIVDDQYVLSDGLTIYAKNLGGGPDVATIFDSSKANSRDPDLVGPGASTWNKGNLAPNQHLGKLLILAENDIDRNEDGLIDNPDDEGSRPAGSLFFEFDSPISEFGFDLVDVEGPSEITKDSGYAATFYLGPNELARVSFADFVDPVSTFYDSSVAFGNNSANRIVPLTAANLGLLEFDRVEMNFGGSAAIDNINWDRPGTFVEVPNVSTVWMIVLGLLLMLTVGFMYRSRVKGS